MCSNYHMIRSETTRAFTLVELLIVISIIGILAQLALPAVQSAREAARKTSCINNLRQVTMAFQLHEGAHGHLPTGGWGWYWMGDPDRGYGADQPGGWAFNILPYIEEELLRDSTRGTSDSEREDLNQRLVSTPIKILICPSRRQVSTFPYVLGVDFPYLGTPTQVARTDYAANLGTQFEPLDTIGPDSYEMAEEWKKGDDSSASWVATNLDGVVFQRSRVKLGQITDGLTKTLLIAEKYIPVDGYENGTSHGDNEHLYMGYDHDILRTTNSDRTPRHDSLEDSAWRFGSVHPTSFQAAQCDGSVKSLTYDIDPFVFHAEGSRNGDEIESLSGPLTRQP